MQQASAFSAVKSGNVALPKLLWDFLFEFVIVFQKHFILEDKVWHMLLILSSGYILQDFTSCVSCH